MAVALAAVLVTGLAACSSPAQPDTGSQTSGSSSSEPKEAGGKIWNVLGEDMEAFAENFSADAITNMVYYFAGEGGVTTYTVSDADIIQDVFDALDKITVEAATDEVAEDYSEGFVFEDSEGNTFSVDFNMGNLEAGTFEHYLIGNDRSLWALTNIITNTVKPDGDNTEQTAEKESFGRWSWTYEKLSDGSYEMLLDDALLVCLPSSWNEDQFKYMIPSQDSDFFSFYHIDSYNKYMEKYGFTGGLLFSIGFYTDDSYEMLPHYDYLGEANGGVYVIMYPTDLQAWSEDQAVMDEYNQLYGGVEYVKANTHMV